MPKPYGIDHRRPMNLREKDRNPHVFCYNNFITLRVDLFERRDLMRPLKPEAILILNQTTGSYVLYKCGTATAKFNQSPGILLG